MSQPAKMLLTGSRGVVGTAIRTWMRTNHPEVQVVPLYPFPFSLEKLWDAVRDGSVTYLVNCAGVSGDEKCTEEPHSCLSANVTGVLNQLECLRRHSPHTRHLSFGSIYEDTHTTPYAAGKRAMRELVKSYREQYGLYAVVAKLGFTESCLRPSTVLSRKIVSGAWRVAKALKAGQPFEPLQLRSIDERFTFTWAEDVASGIWRMLNQAHHEHDGSPAIDADDEWWREYEKSRREAKAAWGPKDYTLSSPVSASVREFVELAFKEAGVMGDWLALRTGETYRTYIPDSSIKDIEANSTELVRVVVDSGAHEPPFVDTAAQRDLNWQSTVSFPELVKRMMTCEMEGNPLL